jgi:hypothetical protein
MLVLVERDGLWLICMNRLCQKCVISNDSLSLCCSIDCAKTFLHRANRFRVQLCKHERKQRERVSPFQTSPCVGNKSLAIELGTSTR